MDDDHYQVSNLETCAGLGCTCSDNTQCKDVKLSRTLVCSYSSIRNKASNTIPQTSCKGRRVKTYSYKAIQLKINIMSSFNLPTSQVAAQFTTGTDPVASIKVNQTAEVPTFPSSGTNTFVRIDWASIDPIDYKLLGLPWPIVRLVLGAYPITPNQTFAGRVWKTTDPRFKAGDRVWGKIDPSRFGTLAGYTLVKGEKGIVKVPENYNRGLEEFGGAGVIALTALQSLKQADIPYNTSGGSSRGGAIFINGGSGGVGTFAVQMAKHALGVDKVVVSCSSANIDLVKSLGADEVVDYRKLGSEGIAGWLKDWSKRNGQQFDAILDNVGSDDTIYWQSQYYLKPGKGQYIQVGGGLDFAGISSTAKKMFWPSLLGGGKRKFQFLGLKPENSDLDQIAQWMAEGKIKTIIEDENKYDLVDTKKAYQKLQTGRTRGKIVIKVGADDQ